MTPAPKRKFLYGEMPVGILSVCVFAMLISVKVANVEIGLFVPGLVFGVLILAVYFLSCWLDIRQSRKRHPL
jgi:hypothetical protein